MHRLSSSPSITPSTRDPTLIFRWSSLVRRRWTPRKSIRRHFALREPRSTRIHTATIGSRRETSTATVYRISLLISEPINCNCRQEIRKLWWMDELSTTEWSTPSYRCRQTRETRKTTTTTTTSTVRKTTTTRATITTRITTTGTTITIRTITNTTDISRRSMG